MGGLGPALGLACGLTGDPGADMVGRETKCVGGRASGRFPPPGQAL